MISKKNVHINHLKLIKRKKPPSLYYLINDLNDVNKRINIIHLSQLIKTKNNKETINFSQRMKEKNIKQNNAPLSLKNSKLNKYKFLSCRILPSKYSNIKLPKIKNLNQSIELKDSKLDSIINKFDEYDDKFKKRAKFSFDAGGMKYVHYKLNKGLDIQPENDNSKSKYNFKKIYSKIFKRIKKIKEFQSILVNNQFE